MTVCRKSRNKESGFSLIELLIVLAILAVLAAVAIPGFSTFLPNYRLKRAAQDLFSSMQLAKMEAIKANAARTIQFTPAAGTYTKPDGTVVTLADYGSGVSYGHGAAGKTVSGASGTATNMVTFASDQLTFNTRGMMATGSGNSGYVYITNSKQTVYAVGTLSSGVVRMLKWNGTAYQ